MRLFAVLILLVLPVSFAYASPVPATSGVQADSAKYANNIQRAANYLVANFNPAVGLVSESPDQGTHWLKRTEYPNYQWSYGETYWIYSDNLFAEYALLPWYPNISAQINATYQHYNPPFSNKFESIMGIPVGPDRQATDVIVNSSTIFVVLYRIHNGAYADPNIPFADAIVYRALSEHYLGQQDLAVKDVNWAASLWNGTCVIDYGVTQTELTPGNAPSDINWCMNSKVGLILYAAEVVGVTLPNFAEMEAHLWSMQNSVGGIVTLATGHGEKSGSSNTETTAATLLVYNQALITRLRNNVATIPEYQSTQILILAVTLILMGSMVLIHRRRETK